jgi:hypothetical protein
MRFGSGLEGGGDFLLRFGGMPVLRNVDELSRWECSDGTDGGLSYFFELNFKVLCHFLTAYHQCHSEQVKSSCLYALLKDAI